MTERMGQISLRQFRERIAEIDAPVEVSRRGPQGNIQVLGYWTPYGQVPSGAKPLELIAELTDTPGPIRDPGPAVRSFPKSAQLGKKK